VKSVLAISAHAGVRLAEVGYLLILFAGVWLVAAEIPMLRMRRTRRVVAGVALAVAGILLIIATRSGHFGQP
jgi:drug/metabolite transporter (DMT)-like permease